MQVEFMITFEDIIVYFIAVLYAVTVLTVADVARRKLNMGSDFTRKIVHLFAGAAIWTVPYYPHPWVATLVALTFVIMLGMASSHRFERFFHAMARSEDEQSDSVRGPFWYAVSITVLTAIFTFTGNDAWYFIAAAAIHIMMLGDGLSAPIGMKWGVNHCIEIKGSKRSLHGCSALFIFGFIGSLIAFWFFGVVNYQVFVSGGQILFIEMIILALAGAVTATLVELVSPKGTDNVTVPMICTVVMFYIAILLGIIVI
ncbi:MAG: conserved membrane protein of unknown function [Candidatus Thorarchaeota archaeon]|nr:MAG: conserved membrane protein of unknown function [Candidatus Thorarchaeota archaeon]